MQIKPFFINSNICLKQDDISSFEKFMTSIAGNTGNSYITYALIKELFGGLVDIKHIQNIYEYNFDNEDTDIDYINNESTHVFLILQDQIRIKESYGLKLPYKKIMNFISKLNKPVIIAGLGANSFNGFDSDFHKKLDPNLIDFLKFLSEHCTEIGIRGHYTEEVLHKIGIDNTRVIGCPFFYEMGKDRIITKKDTLDLKSIVLTSRLPKYMRKIHKISQDFLEEDVIKPIAFNIFEDHIDTQHIEAFFNQTYHVFSNIENWKTFLKDFNFAIGYRLHGAIAAINSGVPALCMNGDSRATEMCSFLKIPHNPKLNIQNENEILKIYEEVDYTELNSNYPKLFDNFIKFLHNNNLQHIDENIEQKNLQNYIKQPELSLYSENFYTDLKNIILFGYSKEINTINIQLNESINNYVKQNDKNIIELYNRTDEIYKKLDNLHNENQNLNAKLEKLLNKPSFIQQLFSIKNEKKHKVWRILGIKIKFRRK